MRLSKKSMIVIAVSVALVAAAAASLIFFLSGRVRRADLKYLRQAEYNAVFFSMVPYEDVGGEAVGEDFFSLYLGLKTATVPGCIRNAEDVIDYLEAALNSGNEVSLVALELLPEWAGGLGALGDLIGAHPDTTFKLLLNAPSMEYWTSQSESGAQRQLNSCRQLAETVLAHGNAEFYFAGAEDWLILNRRNYSAPLVANRDIARHLALLTLCDSNYRLTADNYTATFSGLEEKIIHARTVPASTDLSDWCMVFFGDSVIGNYTDSATIPNAVAALSGCEAYNLGVGGTPAVFEGPELYSFPVIVDSFLKQKTVTLPEGAVCPREMEAFYEKEHNGKQMCFVVNYGLNDYFSGAPVDNLQDPYDTAAYAGALRSGIRELRTAYPDAVIILAAPNYVEYFSAGQEKQSDVGGRLTDYVEAAGRVAGDTDVILMNNYYDLGIDASNSASYLVDGCHPGDNGRFLYAQALIRLIGLHCPQE